MLHSLHYQWSSQWQLCLVVSCFLIIAAHGHSSPWLAYEQARKLRLQDVAKQIQYQAQSKEQDYSEHIQQSESQPRYTRGVDPHGRFYRFIAGPDSILPDLQKRVSLPMCGDLNYATPIVGKFYRGEDGHFFYDLDACKLRRLSHLQARQCLASKYLVFLGDSVTRYQYLALMHWLIKGQYQDRYDDDPYSVTNRHQWGEWPVFYAGTLGLVNNLLGRQGKLSCNCSKDEEREYWRLDLQLSKSTAPSSSSQETTKSMLASFRAAPPEIQRRASGSNEPRSSDKAASGSGKTSTIKEEIDNSKAAISDEERSSRSLLFTEVSSSARITSESVSWGNELGSALKRLPDILLGSITKPEADLQQQDTSSTESPSTLSPPGSAAGPGQSSTKGQQSGTGNVDSSSSSSNSWIRMDFAYLKRPNFQLAGLNGLSWAFNQSHVPDLLVMNMGIFWLGRHDITNIMEGIFDHGVNLAKARSSGGGAHGSSKGSSTKDKGDEGDVGGGSSASSASASSDPASGSRTTLVWKATTVRRWDSTNKIVNPTAVKRGWNVLDVRSIARAAEEQKLKMTWDHSEVHFLPIVYEQFNDLLLNILCPAELYPADAM